MISRPSLMATGQRKIEDLFVYGIARPTGGHRAVNFRLNAPFALMYGIVKRLPGVLACDQVDFDVRRGEVHALLGENGAGKSTLMRILYGLHQPDEGRILRDGAEELGLLLAGVYPAKQKGREQERNSLAGRRGRLLEPLNGSPSNTLVSKRRGLARRLSDRLAGADQQRQDEHNTHYCPRMSNSHETVSSVSDGSRHILSEAVYRPSPSGPRN